MMLIERAIQWYVRECGSLPQEQVAKTGMVSEVRILVFSTRKMVPIKGRASASFSSMLKL